MIKGIIFDFDGTLSYRVKSAYCMYKDMLQQLLPQLDPNGIELEARVQRCMLYDEFGTINKRHVLNMIKDKWVPDMDVEAWVDYWYKNFHRFQFVMPGALEALDRLKEKYVLAIVSNGPKESQEPKIDQLGLRPYFQYVLTSGEFGVHKPDPSIYEAMAGRMGLKCEEVAFIGDTFDTDILGAVRAGMRPIWMCYEHRCVSDMDIPQVESFEQIERMFL